MYVYVVSRGDTVDSIAGKLGVDVDRLIYDNQLVYPYRLAIGQALLIENGQQERIMEVVSNGYAYPFIKSWVLDGTLPFLSEMSVFSYGFTVDGVVVPPELDDKWMIAAAVENGARPILTLTPFGADGNFNNNLISAIVRNVTARDLLIEGLVEIMKVKGFVGLDIDFEYIKAEDRDYFTEFVAACKAAMENAGFTLAVALAPKTSANQKGLLYEGKDYLALGAIADYVLIMTYEWGYKYGPPMAVAPIDKVRQVIEYAVTEILPSKISLGVPNYGYDWPLPYEQNSTVARTIGNVEAVQIAINNGAEIMFDEVAQSPYFNYRSGDVEHVVWFEDVRSLGAKFNLIEEFGLRGVGYWQIMQFYRANWLLLEDKFYVKKSYE